MARNSDRWAWPAAVAALVMSCGPKQPPCEPVAQVEERWTREGLRLIESGACDKYTSVQLCPAWQELRLGQRLRQAQEDQRCSN